MSNQSEKVLAIIPARAGSKGLPLKNIRPFCGIPLVRHAVLCASMIPEVTKIAVSSDSEEILTAASPGPEFLVRRPAALAQDDSPVWDTVRYALTYSEQWGDRFEYVVLLEPTSPCRKPEWVSEALQLLKDHPHADGVHGISLTPFNPIWNCLVEFEGYLDYLVPQGRFYHRRQDVPPTYRMDGSLHVWRARFVREHAGGYHWGQYVGYKTDPRWACSIDTLEEFEELEEKVKKGVIKLAWKLQ